MSMRIGCSTELAQIPDDEADMTCRNVGSLATCGVHYKAAPRKGDRSKNKSKEGNEITKPHVQIIL
jgi:hypothetical protein